MTFRSVVGPARRIALRRVRPLRRPHLLTRPAEAKLQLGPRLRISPPSQNSVYRHTVHQQQQAAGGGKDKPLANIMQRVKTAYPTVKDHLPTASPQFTNAL